ncbi:transposase [Xanthomonas oryzae pv. oryzae]|uniref:Transposase n=1 Tax=Xanthomonas oryzae pv. oryzae (strain PXO99A) TaxID=360094 RepID=A0A0K0GIL1_XANOP|nr:transposase [Xanthomonas oryzae pv. oryzae PXO99A]AXQ10127.1 transposase [Xanthomonas oryzae pv. oryzae]UWZ70080.1 transposase [Xanthomonas oryzae pv. oryzae]
MTTATHAAEPARREDGRCHDHCCTSSTDNEEGERDPDMHQTKKATSPFVRDKGAHWGAR